MLVAPYQDLLHVLVVLITEIDWSGHFDVMENKLGLSACCVPGTELQGDLLFQRFRWLGSIRIRWCLLDTHSAAWLCPRLRNIQRDLGHRQGMDHSHDHMTRLMVGNGSSIPGVFRYGCRCKHPGYPSLWGEVWFS